MDDVIYDLCIVGAGMFGSAAARHASANVGVKVCLVGPDEPVSKEKETREIFGSHYDESRITRILDTDISRQILSRESINRYRKLEELSGIDFYSPVGLLYVTKQKSSASQNLLQSANISNLPVVDLSHGDIFEKRFPYIKLKKDDIPLLEDFGAGHISPRKMVAAQKEVAKSQGCKLLNKIVKEVTPLADGIHKIITEDNQEVKTKRVLICTGAYTNMKKFPMSKLLMHIEKEFAVLFQLSNEEARRLSSMPSIIYRNDEEGVYILPPIMYPDGSTYLKIGLSYPKDDSVKIGTSDEVKKWFLSKEDPKKVEMLKRILTDMLPGLKIERTGWITCVNSYNPSGLPYIDRVSSTVTIAAIANGKGAKFSDEIGRIAATLSLSGKWDSNLPETNFKVMFENFSTR